MAKNVAHMITFSLVSIILASIPNLALAASAIHIDTNACDIIIDPDGSSVKAPGKIVMTHSPDGNILLVCHTHTTNNTGKAFVTSGSETGILCEQYDEKGIKLGSTYDWKSTVSASGKATLSCHFKIV